MAVEIGRGLIYLGHDVNTDEAARESPQRPRIKRNAPGLWECRLCRDGLWTVGHGSTPVMAYEHWWLHERQARGYG